MSTIINGSSPSITFSDSTTQTTAFTTTPTINTITSAAATPLTLQSAGTTAITLDTSQNAIIGDTTTQYSSKLYVNSSIAARNSGVDGTFQNAFVAGYSGNYNERNIIQTAVSSSAAGSGFSFLLSNGGGGSTTSTGYTMTRAGHTWYYNNGTSGMVLDVAGVLCIGSTSNTWGVAGALKTVGITSHAGSTGAYQTNGFNFQWTGNPALWVDTTNLGNIQVSSDYRIKRNIETQSAPALERVMALRPVTYQRADYKDGLFKASDDIKEGFIAHEIQEVIPSGADGVKDDPDQIQSLRLDAILSVVVKAIQELNAKVIALEGK